MQWTNEAEIDTLKERYTCDPVLGPATHTLSEYRDLINDCSDGWCHWSYGTRCAGSLVELVTHADHYHRGHRHLLPSNYHLPTAADVRKATAAIDRFVGKERQLAGRCADQWAAGRNTRRSEEGPRAPVERGESARGMKIRRLAEFLEPECRVTWHDVEYTPAQLRAALDYGSAPNHTVQLRLLTHTIELYDFDLPERDRLQGWLAPPGHTRSHNPAGATGNPLRQPPRRDPRPSIYPEGMVREDLDE